MKLSYFSFLFLFITSLSYGQLVVSNNAPYNTINNLINNVLLSTSSGGAATNVSLNAGNGVQVGYFNGASSNIGIGEGILLSTGGIGQATPQNDGLIAGSPSVTDPDLNYILQNIANTNENQFNTIIVEFDFVAGGTEIEFEYVFASSEYAQYTCSKFNDVFGFFLSGPGISGPYSNNAKNIALVPNPAAPTTFTNTPVMINTVNSGSATGGNPSGNCESIDPNWELNKTFFVDNSSVGTVSFNGFTKVFKAKADVQCGETYHIKLAICDVSDDQLNSAVFLKKESFQIGAPLTIGIAGQDSFIKCVDKVEVDPQVTGGLGTVTITWTKDGVFYSNDPIQTFTENGTYTITAVDECGEVSHTITVEDYTAMSLSIPDTVILCDPYEIVPEFSGGAPLFQYSWTGAGISSEGLTLPLNPGVNGLIFLDILDDCGFEIKDTTFVFTPEELIASAPEQIYLCEGGVDLTGEFSGGYGDVIYYWELNGTVTYDLTITLGLGDGGTASFHVLDDCGDHLINQTEVLSPGPFDPISIDVVQSSFTICDRDKFQFPITVEGGAVGVNYEWYVDGDLVSTQVNYSIEGHNFTTGEYLIQLVLRDVCDNTLEHFFKIKKIDCFVPNVFTPKGDLVNDGFYFPIGTYQSNIRFQVFDRWGLEVYNNDNYERCNENVLDQCWQGENQSNGNQCLDGVYFYLITFKDGNVEKGTVQIFNE
ncbi:MAG: choice-of-anchor L domain-containing protein [Flavobacteriales bacterium]